ncbi:PEP-CTERM sorting domain-containing protein [Massilia sp. ST3]|uniref:PEP-CTERM sorting domain-containing protein n=1 Tax=Massilia sp. ST3 TaxID=2824903 RepID=UPI001B83E273|nr:PEP-CTERM sorting domain-containing protein [Massilia sp. ST3]MBQ5949464.1 PEP-CTERM sorting domain-containing protein [Massilia sp. ST3]
MASTTRFRAAGLAAWFIASGAVAQTAPAPAGAEASLGQLRYELVDLTPDDGQAPWLTLAPSYRGMTARIGGNDTEGPAKDLSANGTLELEAGADHGWGELRDDGLANGASAGDSMVAVSGWASYLFWFSPNTRVIFQVDGRSFTPGDDPQGDYHAAVGMSGAWYRPEGPQEARVDLASSDGQGLREGLLELTMRSDSAASNGSLNLNAYAWASVSPVPEPAQAAMLLAGGVGLLAWPRRKKPARP